MGTTLIFVRHGESEANGNGFFAGQLDIALSRRGFRQAEMTAGYIQKNFHVDAVYSSDLQRAYCTALPIAKACCTEPIKSEQLREIFAGRWQGLCFDELQVRYADAYDTWLKDIGCARPSGGETVKQLSDRIWAEVREIACKEQNKTVVIVTHATPIRTLLCRFHGLDLNQMKQIPWVSNSSVTVVRFDGTWNLLQEGFDMHLSELKTHFPANV